MMTVHKSFACSLVILWSMVGHAAIAFAASQDPADLEFFENRIRPVLAQDCYECHQSKGPKKGGLVLDHREALLQGGDSGPAIVPRDPDASLLIRAIRHTSADLQMPKSRAPLESHVIQDFELWIENGATDPRDQPPSEEEITEDTNWNAIMERRKNWWSFQPVIQPSIPYLDTRTRPQPAHPVDAFIQKSLEINGLQPSEQANKQTLLRRLSFTLKGLPPSPIELENFLADNSATAFERKVDEYLNSPHFGERWARHWMDWIRYAESHGSEGDPTIPNAWYYRDYLIRALNQDIPYDQLILEQLAGDLIPSPRINTFLGLNESAIGTSQLRMVFHGFAPTDALEEQVRFTDDQINVVSKAFQGITVSCARCHDHKFDPISQKDFYAWYGIMASGRPAMIEASLPVPNESQIRLQMRQLKKRIQSGLLDVWMEDTANLHKLLTEPKDSLNKNIQSSQKGNFLWPLKLINQSSEIADKAWEEFRSEKKIRANHPSGSITAEWDFTDPKQASSWYADGPGLLNSSPNGSWTLESTDDQIVQDILPGGMYSHEESTKDRGLLHSPMINLDKPYDLWLLISGDGQSMARYAVQNYPRNGTVYPVETLNGSKWRWKKFPLKYWQGDNIHIELSTAADQPVLAKLNQTRSWFGIRRAVMTLSDSPAPELPGETLLKPLLKVLENISTKQDLIEAYQKALVKSLKAWGQSTITGEQSLFLNAALKAGWLSNSMETIPDELSMLVKEWRKLESRLKPPVRVPGQYETAGFDQVLFERGNHKKPLNPVPRRFLEFLDDTPYASKLSGRLELAQDMIRPDNPLTTRVIVNRIWHHLFGKGIVVTPDNFGRLGQKPTHPELLDFLAHRFRENGWSIKKMIRYLVTSETWRQSSEVSQLSAEKDPDNKLWSHYSIRRLEAESIRDTLLFVSNKLDLDSMYGSPVNGGTPRRSVYVQVKRNNLDPFLTLFDAPVPASTRGNRDATNVPGQSLSLLNDPFVMNCSEAWADSILKDQATHRMDSRRMIQSLFVSALGRPPTLSEKIQSEHFLKQMDQLSADKQARLKSLSEELDSLKSQQEELEKIGRDRALSGKEPRETQTSSLVLKPVASWDFSTGLQDEVGNLNLELLGEAKLHEGTLVLNGRQSFAKTPPINMKIQEKTLEAWVQLDDLNQRGGGVMSIQDLSGNVFDAIVYGEQESRKWLAGSNNFQRTQSYGGLSEQDADQGFVHIALTYQTDGTIHGYRNGKAYGKPYQSSGTIQFNAGNSQILFGNRHGSPGGNRLLKGKIAKARLYDRALTADEVMASFTESPNYISRKDMIAELDPKEKDRYHFLIGEIQEIEKQIKDGRSKKGLSSAWADLAHAIFNLKEFIYVQ